MDLSAKNQNFALPHDLETEHPHAVLSGRWFKMGRSLAASKWAYAFVFFFAFFLFSKSLGNFFVMDDFWHLHRIASMDWKDWWKPWLFSAHDTQSYWMAMHQIRDIQDSSYFFRPVVTLTFLLTEKLGNGAPWVFHLITLFLHSLNTLVSLAIARRFFGKNLASLGAALIFAVHPSHCGNIQWISANGDLLAGLFFFLAFYGHLRSREASGNHPWRWAIFAGGSFFLALSSKEMAIMFPAVAFLYDLLFYRPRPVMMEDPDRVIPLRPRPFWRTKAFYGIPAIYAVISFFYLADRWQVLKGVTALNDGGNYIANFREPGFFSAIFVNLATYLWHFWTLFPLLPFDTRQAWQQVPWLVLAVWGALIAFSLWLGWKISNKRLYLFFLAWQVLTALPALPILISQHLIYIPSLGFCLLVGLLLKEKWLPLLENRKPGRWWFPVTLGVCFLMTFMMNEMWRRPSLMVHEQIEQIVQELPKPEPGSRIYLLDIWPPSYGLEEGLYRRYGDRTLDIQILSFSPKIIDRKDPSWIHPMEKLFALFFPEASGPLVTHHRLEKGPDGMTHLHLELEGDSYFHGLVEGLLPVETRLGNELKELQTKRFQVTMENPSHQGVNEIDFSFKEDGQKSYFLLFDKGRYRRIST